MVEEKFHQVRISAFFRGAAFKKKNGHSVLVKAGQSLAKGQTCKKQKLL